MEAMQCLSLFSCFLSCFPHSLRGAGRFQVTDWQPVTVQRRLSDRIYTQVDWVNGTVCCPLMLLFFSYAFKQLGNPSIYIYTHTHTYTVDQPNHQSIYVSGKCVQSQRRKVITKIVQRREPEGKGRQTWRGMLIKLWTSAILLLLCFCFAYENS